MKNKQQNVMIILAFLIVFAIIVITPFFSKHEVAPEEKLISKYMPYVEKYSEIYSVEKNMILAIIKAESSFNSNAVSKSGAIGLMQITKSTYENDIKVRLNLSNPYTDLYDAEFNIMCGTYFYSLWRDYYNSDILAIASYNAGSGTVRNWINNEETFVNCNLVIDNVPYPETKNHINKVLNFYNEFNLKYGSEQLTKTVDPQVKRYVSKDLCLKYCFKYGQMYNVDPYMVMAIIQVESGFNANATARADSIGMAQILKATFEVDIKPNINYKEDYESLYNPENSIRCCAYYLSWLKDRVNRVSENASINEIAAAYNGGINAVRSWLSDEIYSEDGKLLLDKIPNAGVVNYINKVNNAYNEWANK